MPKINKRTSVVLSFVLAILALLFVAAVAATIPFLDWHHIGTEHTTYYPYQVIIALLYVILVPAVVADIALLQLLGNVRKSLVFTANSVSRIRLISWCCFAETLLFGVLCVSMPLALVIAFAAAFLGVVLRVVKNVIEEAVDIKTENDFTV